MSNGVASSALRCARRVPGILLGRRLHLERSRWDRVVRLPDGRAFRVYRETWLEDPDDGDAVTLAVWFHLRGVPPGAGVRRWLFERESILNTVLFAGCRGFERKLWMVDPMTSDYAGAYTWRGPAEADAYGQYITALLRPLSAAGSVGWRRLEGVALDDLIVGGGSGDGASS